MTRDEAARLIQGFATAVRAPCVGLNADDQARVTLPEVDVFFELHGAELECSALIHHFLSEPRPALIEGFKAEQRRGAPTGGGDVDYEPENHGLYLSRHYGAAVPATTFTEEMKALARAARRWSTDVFPRVAEKVIARA